MLAGLIELETTLIKTPEGKALKVWVVDHGLGETDAAEIERIYRKGLQVEFEKLETRGLSTAQLPKSIPLDLKSVYLELGLIPIREDREQEEELQEILQSDETRRLMHEMRDQQERVTGAIARNQKLVIVGKPGSGKTVSLKFIALMLAYGEPGASRLRLDRAYFPVYMSLARYAEQLKTKPALALETYLHAIH